MLVQLMQMGMKESHCKHYSNLKLRDRNDDVPVAVFKFKLVLTPS